MYHKYQMATERCAICEIAFNIEYCTAFNFGSTKEQYYSVS